MDKEEDSPEKKNQNGSSTKTTGEVAIPLKEFHLTETGAVAGVNTFEDVLEIIGTSGAWNILVFILCCYSAFTMPMNVVSYQLIGATPDHWCRVETLMHANWTQQQVIALAIPKKPNSDDHENCLMYDYDYAMAVNLGYEASLANRHLLSRGGGEPYHCFIRDFNFTQYVSTLVTEWDLVCERLPLYATTQSVSHIGLLIGSGISGYLLDLFGRRRVVLICSVFFIVCSWGLVLAPDFQLYVLLKTLLSIFSMSLYVGNFVNVMELCSPRQRCSVGSLFVVPFAIGFMVVPGIAYFVRPWRWLQAAYALPLLPLVLYFWFLPESPRWLLSQGRYEEALKVLSWAAKVNRRPLPPSDALLVSLKAIAKDSGLAPRAKAQRGGKPPQSFGRQLWGKVRHIFVLVLTPTLRNRILLCFFCWFAVSMVYYGVSLNSTNLSTDPYLYIFLGGLVEVPSYLLLWPAIVYLGRRVSLIALYIVCATTVSIIAILLVAMETVPVGVLMFLSLTGKSAITAAFHLSYVFTAELFPIKYRSLAVGESSMIARVGSMISPYINDILGNVLNWAPSAVFALMSLSAAGLAFLLPETGGTMLTEEEQLPVENSDSNLKETGNYFEPDKEQKDNNPRENGSVLEEDAEANCK
ncbi:organic cation transporter protein-like isoform X1 [Macrobrachium nipponense]|uniref:organic cation transporter protein-like isoform X1 n=1 Tax=Macrobrachium nipponense TaxID=159736 RepID=UPI0030C80667